MATDTVRYLVFDSQTSVSNSNVDSVKEALFSLSNSMGGKIESSAPENAEELLAQISNAQTKLIGLLNQSVGLVIRNS